MPGLSHPGLGTPEAGHLTLPWAASILAGMAATPYEAGYSRRRPDGARWARSARRGVAREAEWTRRS